MGVAALDHIPSNNQILGSSLHQEIGLGGAEGPSSAEQANGFKQGGFTRTVFAHQQINAWAKGQVC